MKLIDILVQELPKRGGWPVNAVYAKQSEADYEVYFYKENGCGVRNYFNPGVRVDDCQFFSLEVVTKSDYEAALAASKVPVWDGEGLPPVGCECERSWCGDKWLKCKVLFVGEHTVVVKIPTRESCYDITSVRFRPIRTEAERKREEAGLAIYHAINWNAEGELASPSRMEDYRKAYDAIAAGKIPGIRLTDDAGSQ